MVQHRSFEEKIESYEYYLKHSDLKRQRNTMKLADKPLIIGYLCINKRALSFEVNSKN